MWSYSHQKISLHKPRLSEALASKHTIKLMHMTYIAHSFWLTVLAFVWCNMQKHSVVFWLADNLSVHFTKVHRRSLVTMPYLALLTTRVTNSQNCKQQWTHVLGLQSQLPTVVINQRKQYNRLNRLASLENDLQVYFVFLIRRLKAFKMHDTWN